MDYSRSSSAATKATIAKLAQAPRIERLGPIAARFVYSLRLVALHDRARRDPVPELATRLASVEVAARSLALAQAIKQVWPENIHVSRFCCCAMTHDEATVGAMIDAVTQRDRHAFDAAVTGLIRHDRGEMLHEAAQELVLAELSAR
jgi:hypothetical protein